ncbi:MAG: hypothetical protein KIT72_12090 [Polyangiaceae bacterium]|nr:hypothetical protein [Polyangiaceae bacterium]MCW5791154.1 hypothetical protein [Polyangiaceae bacterium]
MAGDFEHVEGFVQGEISAGLSLGPLEQQYEELFAEALADGVITSDERARLEQAADNLGLNPRRLLELEQAMLSAYESRHSVRIVEHYQEGPSSLAPLRVAADGDAGRALLLKRIEQLEARVLELEQELRQAQAQINVEVDLTDLEVTAEDASEEPDVLWRRVRRDPTQPSHLRALHRAYQARGARDAAWCAAQALVAIGAATSEERAEFEAARVTGLISPRHSVDARSFSELISHPDEEALTGQLFGVIVPAVLLGKVTALRRDKTLHIPDPAARQEPEKSTITAVRALSWAAALLGLAAPPMYLEKERQVGFEHIPGIPPVTVLGSGVLSGRTQLELAFEAGSHLSWYRPDRFIRTLFTSVPDLEDLFLAALTLGSPSLPIAEEMRRRVAPIAQAIAPVLGPEQLDRLRGLFLRFVEEGGRTNLQRWSAGAERTAARAGFAICSDLTTALGCLKEGAAIGELGRDLIAYSVSEPYLELRQRLGVRL